MDDVSEIRAVVFDLGGVLLDWNPRYVYRQLFDDEAEMERFLSDICSMEWHHANDLGAPRQRTCAALAREHPQYATEIRAWAERSEEMIGGEIAGTVTLLGELQAAGVPCFALTNMEAETYPVRRARFAFMRSFDGTVVSSTERVAKPDPEIFRRLLQRFSLSAPATVFVDDVARNVEAASALGFVALRFSSPERLRTDLRRLGLPLGDAA